MDDPIQEIVNTPVGWGKLPIKQDTSWDSDRLSPDAYDPNTLGTHLWKSQNSLHSGSNSISIKNESSNMSVFNYNNTGINGAAGSVNAFNQNNGSSLNNVLNFSSNTFSMSNIMNNGQNFGNHNNINNEQPPQQSNLLNNCNLMAGGNTYSDGILSQNSSQHSFMVPQFNSTDNNHNMGAMNTGNLKSNRINNEIDHFSGFSSPPSGTMSSNFWNDTANANNDDSKSYNPFPSAAKVAAWNTHNTFQQNNQIPMSSSTNHPSNPAPLFRNLRDATTPLSGDNGLSGDLNSNFNGPSLNSGNFNSNNHFHSNQNVMNSGNFQAPGSSFNNNSNFNGNNPLQQNYRAIYGTNYNSSNNNSCNAFKANNLGYSVGEDNIASHSVGNTSSQEDQDNDSDGGGIGVWKSVEAAKQETSMYWNPNLINNLTPGESLSVLDMVPPPNLSNNNMNKNKFEENHFFNEPPNARFTPGAIAPEFNKQSPPKFGGNNEFKNFNKGNEDVFNGWGEPYSSPAPNNFDNSSVPMMPITYPQQHNNVQLSQNYNNALKFGKAKPPNTTPDYASYNETLTGTMKLPPIGAIKRMTAGIGEGGGGLSGISTYESSPSLKGADNSLNTGNNAASNAALSSDIDNGTAIWARNINSEQTSSPSSNHISPSNRSSLFGSSAPQGSGINSRSNNSNYTPDNLHYQPQHQQQQHLNLNGPAVNNFHQHHNMLMTTPAEINANQDVGVIGQEKHASSYSAILNNMNNNNNNNMNNNNMNNNNINMNNNNNNYAKSLKRMEQCNTPGTAMPQPPLTYGNKMDELSSSSSSGASNENDLINKLKALSMNLNESCEEDMHKSTFFKFELEKLINNIRNGAGQSSENYNSKLEILNNFAKLPGVSKSTSQVYGNDADIGLQYPDNFKGRARRNEYNSNAYINNENNCVARDGNDIKSAATNNNIVNQQLDQLKQAISSGLIDPAILNLKLSPQVLLMLTQLLNLHKTSQNISLALQQIANVAMNNSQKHNMPNNNMVNREQCDLLNMKYEQVKQQIIQLQAAITIAVNGNASSMTTNCDNESTFTASLLPQPIASSSIGNTDKPANNHHVNGSSATSLQEGDKEKSEIPSPSFSQKSRLMQWKLLSPPEDKGHNLAHVNQGEQEKQTNNNNANEGCGEEDKDKTLVDTSTTSDINAQNENANSKNNSKNQPNDNNYTNYQNNNFHNFLGLSADFKIAEFTPGKPWTGYKSSNIENDPYITPGSLASNARNIIMQQNTSSSVSSILSQFNPNKGITGNLSTLNSQNKDDTAKIKTNLIADDYLNVNKQMANGMNILNINNNNMSNNNKNTGGCFSLNVNEINHPQQLLPTPRFGGTSNTGNNLNMFTNNNNINMNSSLQNRKLPLPLLNHPAGVGVGNLGTSLLGNQGPINPASSNLFMGGGNGPTNSNLLGGLPPCSLWKNSGLPGGAMSHPGYPPSLLMPPLNLSSNAISNPVNSNLLNNMSSNSLLTDSNKPTWLVLHNLAQQAEASTLKSLCSQHGIVKKFYLNKPAGEALVLYSNQNEANRALKVMDCKVLWNAPIQATIVNNILPQ